MPMHHPEIENDPVLASGNIVIVMAGLSVGGGFLMDYLWHPPWVLNTMAGIALFAGQLWLGVKSGILRGGNE